MKNFHEFIHVIALSHYQDTAKITSIIHIRITMFSPRVLTGGTLHCGVLFVFCTACYDFVFVFLICLIALLLYTACVFSKSALWAANMSQ